MSISFDFHESRRNMVKISAQFFSELLHPNLLIVHKADFGYLISLVFSSGLDSAPI